MKEKCGWSDFVATINCKRRDGFDYKACTGCEKFITCQGASDTAVSIMASSLHQRGKFCSSWKGSQCRICQHVKFLIRTLRHFGGQKCGRRCEACHSARSTPHNPREFHFKDWWIEGRYCKSGNCMPKYLQAIYCVFLSKKKYAKKF